MAVITFDRLSSVVRGKTVLADITWEIERGQNWAVIGPNGAGKTSLLKIILGHLYYRGNFFIEAGLRDRISYVSFDKQAMVMHREAGKWYSRDYSGDSNHEILQAKDMIAGQADKDHRDKTSLALVEHFEIGHLLERNIQHLSTGEMRKILIIQAMAAAPELLILDEPYSGLDAWTRKSMMAAIERLIAANVQVILVTHRFEEIPKGIDRLLCMKGGAIYQQTGRDEVFNSDLIPKLYNLKAREYEPPENRSSPSLHSADTLDGHLVSMKNVTVTYEKTVILKGVNWQVNTGENWLVRGPNGSGKTTLLSMITADHPQAYANEIYLFGKRRGTGESVWDIKQKIGMISAEFQMRYTMPSTPVTAYQVVLSGFFDSIGLFRQASREQRRAAAQWLERLSLMDYGERNFERLSYGEQRMVLIARAMVKYPAMLILDEPFRGVDYANRKFLMQLLDDIGMNTNTTVIYVTHGRERLECITHMLDYDRATSQFNGSSIFGDVCCDGVIKDIEFE